MTKTKRQLRAEAVERLNGMDEWCDGVKSGADFMKALLWDLRIIDEEHVRDALIDLLTDDCGPCYSCAKLAELVAENSQLRGIVGDLKVPTDPGEASMMSVDAFVKKQTEHESRDSREKLEDEIRSMRKRSSIDLSHSDIWVEVPIGVVLKWLDRQAAITEHTAGIAAKEASKVLRETIADLREDVAERDDVIAVLKAENAELESRHCEWSDPDSLGDGCMLRKDKRVDELTAERDEWKAKAGKAERAMNKAAGNWCKADDKAGYWKSEVEECLKAARIESVSEGVMAYPRHEGYTAPSLLVRSQFDYLDQLCVDLNHKLDERKCPGYEPESHHCRYHHQDFELNHQTVSRLKRENANLARDLGECMAENEKLKAGLLPQSDDEGMA